MSEEANRTSGLFIPYPLLGIMLTLTMALVAGIVGLYAQLSAMNTTMILRDNAYQQQLLEIKKIQEVQGEYVRDLRERIIRQEATTKKRG